MSIAWNPSAPFSPSPTPRRIVRLRLLAAGAVVAAALASLIVPAAASKAAGRSDACRVGSAVAAQAQTLPDAALKADGGMLAAGNGTTPAAARKPALALAAAAQAGDRPAVSAAAADLARACR